MNQSTSQLLYFIEYSLSEGKKANEEGYYIYSKNELVEGAEVSPSSVSKNMPDIIDYLLDEEKGWLPGREDPISMISDISYSRGVLRFQRNPEACGAEMDYYWAPHPIEPYLCGKSYDHNHRRRGGSEASYGTFPWSWTEEEVEAAYNEWISKPKEQGTYQYSGSGEKKSPEELRIEAIKLNGGSHLKSFKEEYRTYKVCLAAVQNDAQALWYVPDELKTEEIYEEACKHGGSILWTIPEESRNATICEYAVISEGEALQYVPEALKTKELCRKAAISSAKAYGYMPIDFITAEFVADVAQKSTYDSIESLPEKLKKNPFYYELVKLDPEFIFHLPRKALTAKIGKAAIKGMGYTKTADAVKARPELLSRLHTSLYDHETCLNFVQSALFHKAATEEDPLGGENYGFNNTVDQEKGRLFFYPDCVNTYSLPDMMKWPDVAASIVGLDGCYITFASDNAINEDICLKAIGSNARIFTKLPEQFKTYQVCKIAFEKDPSNIKYFPEEYITMELVLQAVQHGGFILKYLPDAYKTHEVCLIAVGNQGKGNIEDVPKQLLDKEIGLAWLENTEWKVKPLNEIPKELWDYDILLAAVKQDGSELSKVTEEHLTDEMCLAAVTKDNYAAKYVPRNMFTQEMAYAMVEHTALNFEFIPTEVLNEEICLKAISHGNRYGGTILGKIPDAIITQRMCDEAIKKSVWSLKYVPDRFVTEEILVRVAREAPGRLSDNFPERFRDRETIDRMISEVPDAETYLKRFLKS